MRKRLIRLKGGKNIQKYKNYNFFLSNSNISEKKEYFYILLTPKYEYFFMIIQILSNYTAAGLWGQGVGPNK